MNSPILEDWIDIEARTDQVWATISDVCRMSRWSPQVQSTRLRIGSDTVGLGTRFTNRNSHGELEWTTHAEIVRFEPGREIAFRVEENWVVWSFTVSPAGDGSRLTQRREAPDGISPLSLELTEGFMGGVEVFTESMRAGMRETLERIKADLEGSDGPALPDGVT